MTVLFEFIRPRDGGLSLVVIQRRAITNIRDIIHRLLQVKSLLGGSCIRMSGMKDEMEGIQTDNGGQSEALPL